MTCLSGDGRVEMGGGGYVRTAPSEEPPIMDNFALFCQIKLQNISSINQKERNFYFLLYDHRFSWNFFLNASQLLNTYVPMKQAKYN